MEQFFPFLESALRDVKMTQLLVELWTAAGPILELAETGVYLTWGGFCTILSEVSPATPANKALSCKPNTTGLFECL